jgi:hypothetical protein
MASLSKQDRIEISKKLTGIEFEILAVEQQEALNEQALVDAQNKDEPNKKLVQVRTDLIKPYQDELVFLDGITRSELTEQVMLDSARRLKNNSFFPNDPNVPLPSLPLGVWTYLVPFGRTHAIGKTNFEVYPATGGRTEQDIIDEINAKIAIIESYIIPSRATGQECVAGPGSCSGETPPGSGVDETTCLANGGTWTLGPSVRQPSVQLQGHLTDLKDLVQEWEDMLNDEDAVIPTDDPDSTRQTGNDAAKSDIANAILVIDTWQAVQDFDTTTPLPSDCDDFENMIEDDFEQAKLLPITIQPLKDELTARASYIAIRESDVISSTYLGNVVQDLNTGEITAFEGLYGERMKFINLRLNIISGTLTAIAGLETVGSFSDATKAAAEETGDTLSLVMTATLATASGLDTKFLNIKDGSGFSQGDRVYVVANEQEELSGSIVAVDGNRVELTFKIPKKYTIDNQTRLYKLL